ncbi:hypothetical protein EFR94_09515 [Levilactobacillus brevis]|uniref:pyocin knob domain-containing protein n=1 Tax=Levilactobacillus brevis TaxID=1580 RepID=UPI0021A3AD58|nr:pyocin knob domain-containing protein [Levilactobacillus brevis]MCT3567622.1 hypothetical protein [Levilactobacillus brevis]
MAKWNQIVITDAGYQLSAQTLAGKRIQYTHAQTTDKDMSAMTSDQLKAVTKLDDVVQDLSIGIVTVQDDHTVNVPVTVANQDLAADYLLSAMAIYAKPVDPTDGDEILYGIATAVTPDLIPKQDGTTVVGTNFKLKLHVGRADNVEIIITPDGSVSNDELMGILKNYLTQADLNKALPDTIIDSSKPADFKEAVILEKGAVDGAGNAIATTKDVSDGDAKTLTSAKAYADTKVSGKADDSAVVHNTPTILPSGTDLNVVTSSGYYYIVGAINKPENADDWTIYQVVDLRSSLSNGVQIAYDTNGNAQSMRTWSGKGWTPWKLLADDSKVVHLTDMRKPANQVASIDEVNAKQDKLEYTPANDANMFHRSPDTGAVTESGNFPGLRVKGVDVATNDDLNNYYHANASDDAALAAAKAATVPGIFWFEEA